ncbi:hypothetical protein ABBQ38_000705 [Trebouxia sp. C0009 RCD-2024]
MQSRELANKYPAQRQASVLVGQLQQQLTVRHRTAHLLPANQQVSHKVHCSSSTILAVSSGTGNNIGSGLPYNKACHCSTLNITISRARQTLHLCLRFHYMFIKRFFSCVTWASLVMGSTATRTLSY